MAKCIYKFSEQCGRMGSLDGVFIATPARVKKAMGRTAHFGEVLGKHSDISVVLGDDNVTLASDDPAAVKVVSDLDLCTGFNPLDYLGEDE